MAVLEIVLQDTDGVADWARSVKPSDISKTVEELVNLIRDPDVDQHIRNNAAYAFRGLSPQKTAGQKNWSPDVIEYALDELTKVYFNSKASGPAFQEIVLQAMESVLYQRLQTRGK